MPGTAYVDSSALLKLVVREPETAALEADLADREGLLASRLAVVECRRAARRASDARVLQTIDEVLEALYLLNITTAILEAAATTDPPLLRSLDAVHVATVLSIGDADVEVITYDRRFAEAARSSGLTVVEPGRPDEPSASRTAAIPSSPRRVRAAAPRRRPARSR